MTIYKIRNETGNFKEKLLKESYTKALQQIQFAAYTRSSNYAATQNYTNISDLSGQVIVGNSKVGA